ncbi:MAG: NUDIX hydrolase [Christensenellales bacterium]
MDLTEKTVNRNYVYKGKILSPARRRSSSDGKPCVREIVEHCAGAAVLYVADGKIVFVRQFRYAYGEVITEIPAGKVERGEEPLAAAFRELREETGIVPSTMELLQIVYPSTATRTRRYTFSLPAADGWKNPIRTRANFCRLSGSTRKRRRKCLSAAFSATQNRYRSVRVFSANQIKFTTLAKTLDFTARRW